MTEKRFEYKEDSFGEYIDITDSEGIVRNGFGSEITLMPAKDAIAIVDELNVQCAINKMLVRMLSSYEEMEDIMYWIKEAREDMEDG